MKSDVSRVHHHLSGTMHAHQLWPIWVNECKHTKLQFSDCRAGMRQLCINGPVESWKPLDVAVFKNLKKNQTLITSETETTNISRIYRSKHLISVVVWVTTILQCRCRVASWITAIPSGSVAAFAISGSFTHTLDKK